jgi:hypothetical protein
VRGGVMHRMGYKEGAEIIGGVEIGIWRSTIMWTEELLTGDADDLDSADPNRRDPDERKHKHRRFGVMAWFAIKIIR